MNFREGAEGRSIRFICLCSEKLVVDMLVKKNNGKTDSTNSPVFNSEVKKKQLI